MAAFIPVGLIATVSSADPTPTGTVPLTAPSGLPGVPALPFTGTTAASFTIPSSIGHLAYTFGNGATQTVPVSPGAYTIPANLNSPWVAKIVGQR